MEKVIGRMKNRWDENACLYDKHHNSNEDSKKWKELLEKQIGDKNNEVLDIGTGTGFLSLLISELGYCCTAIDFSNGMLDIAKKSANERGLQINFVQGSFYDTGLKDESYDVITNKSVMWTLINPKAAITEWSRLLKKGGKLISFISIYEGNNGFEHSHYDEDIENKLPLKNASKEEYLELFNNSGLFEKVDFIELNDLKNNNLVKESNKHNSLGNNGMIVAIKKL